MDEAHPSSEVFAKEIISLIGHNDISHILDMQIEIKDNLMTSTETLAKMNEFSKQEFNKMEEDFERHTKMMREMKRDLDYIFQKVRVIRSKLEVHNPDSFQDQTH